MHQRFLERLPPRVEGSCPCTVGTPLRWCGDVIQPEHDVCETHRVRREQQARDGERVTSRARLALEEYRRYRNQVPEPTWSDVVDDVVRRVALPPDDPAVLDDGVGFGAARRYFMTHAPAEPLWLFTDYYVWVWRGRMGPDPRMIGIHPVPQLILPLPLARLAHDEQNVHREVVVKQTNENVERLLAVPVPRNQQTETTLTLLWIGKPERPRFKDYFRVISDIHHWFTMRSCKVEGDFLYQNVLRGVVAKIMSVESEEMRTELVKRLWEECDESVGMCCEGHISRLANVFVGFDEAFKPPVSIGELLQTKMAVLSEMEVSVEEKLSLATAYMNEIGVVEEERVPWLEALQV